MSLALYRRYRPESFAEVIGQEHVTGPLQQALRNDRIHHAYLFSGPRGCGKTTSARILARCLNCEQGPTPEPCGVCDSCVALARNGRGSLDVIEIDAASHGGVDDARDLRERAFFAPASSRFKIYIVDEAHMVTTQGFNALLKLVEEPPEHVKFIFATTEPEKVIGTIRSRTHHYPFRLVPPGTLTSYLADLCTREGIAVEPAVLPLVVLAGGGSVRDSLSVLDQLLAGADEGGVTYASATALLGYTDASLLDGIVDAISAGDGGAAFELVDRVVEAGHDPRRFVTDLLDRLRDLILVDAVPDAIDKGLVVGPPEVLSSLPAQAARFGRSELVRAAEIVNVGLTEMRGATAPRLQLELLCARVLLPGVDTAELGLAARVDRLERRLAITAPGGDAVTPLATPAALAPADAPVASTSRPAAKTSDDGPRNRPAATEPAGSTAAQARAAAPAAEAPVVEPTVSEAPAEAVATRGADAAGTEAGQSAAPAASAPARGGGLDAVEVRRLWPTVLESVKSRRRVTWMVLFEKVTVASVDGDALVLAFPDPGSLAGFTAGGHDAVLGAALLDALGVDLRIQAVLDPSRAGGGGGGQARSSASASSGSASASSSWSSQPQQQPSGSRAASQQAAEPATTARPEPAATATQPDGRPVDAAAAAYRRAGAAAAGGSTTSAPAATTPPSGLAHHDEPDEPNPDDDPDADAGLSAEDLLASELGAVVVERVTD